LLGALENLDHLRHDPDDHPDHDQNRHQKHNGRIDESQANLGSQLAARLQIIGQALHHGGKPSGFFAGAHQNAVKRWKNTRETRHGQRKGSALRDLRAQRLHQALFFFQLALLAQNEQRFIDGQPGAQQRRKLPGQGIELRRRQAQARIALRFARFGFLLQLAGQQAFFSQ